MSRGGKIERFLSTQRAAGVFPESDAPRWAIVRGNMRAMTLSTAMIANRSPRVLILILCRALRRVLFFVAFGAIAFAGQDLRLVYPCPIDGSEPGASR